jgi:hypothetical protein
VSRPLTFEDSHFTVITGRYALYLWCDWCDDDSTRGEDAVPVATFHGDQVTLQELNQATGRHDITEHAEEAT